MWRCVPVFQLGALPGESVFWEHVRRIWGELPQFNQHGLPPRLLHPLPEAGADGEEAFTWSGNARFFCLAVIIHLCVCRCSRFPPSLCSAWRAWRAERSPPTPRSSVWSRRASTTTSCPSESTAAGQCVCSNVCVWRLGDSSSSNGVSLLLAGCYVNTATTGGASSCWNQ